MTRKEDLPDDEEARADGGYLQIPRRLALGGIIAFILAVSGPMITFVVSDARQDHLIRVIQQDVSRLETARAEQEKSRSDMRVEVGRLQEKLASMEALIRETRDLIREVARERRGPP
jgi:septal ring factor EnvC (AmiA/AmiB activator)